MLSRGRSHLPGGIANNGIFLGLDQGVDNFSKFHSGLNPEIDDFGLVVQHFQQILQSQCVGGTLDQNINVE